MPTTTNDGVRLYYETAGDGETVAFVGEAGVGAWQWSWQFDRLPRFESVVWDLRGTGRSETPAGPYDVETMAADLDAVLAACEARRAHVVGFGLGGMVALAYAREYGRAASLTLLGTAASGSEVDEDTLRALHAPGDDRESLREALQAGFSEEFLNAQQSTVDRIVEWRANEDADSEGFEAQVAALSSFESGPLYELTLPALVFHGLADPVVPPAAGRALAEELPHGIFESVEGRHLCFIEHSQAVTDRLAAFLDDQRNE